MLSLERNSLFLLCFKFFYFRKCVCVCLCYVQGLHSRDQICQKYGRILLFLHSYIKIWKDIQGSILSWFAEAPSGYNLLERILRTPMSIMFCVHILCIFRLGGSCFERTFTEEECGGMKKGYEALKRRGKQISPQGRRTGKWKWKWI